MFVLLYILGLPEEGEVSKIWIDIEGTHPSNVSAPLLERTNENSLNELNSSWHLSPIFNRICLTGITSHSFELDSPTTTKI